MSLIILDFMAQYKQMLHNMSYLTYFVIPINILMNVACATIQVDHF